MPPAVSVFAASRSVARKRKGDETVIQAKRNRTFIFEGSGDERESEDEELSRPPIRTHRKSADRTDEALTKNFEELDPLTKLKARKLFKRLADHGEWRHLLYIVDALNLKEGNMEAAYSWMIHSTASDPVRTPAGSPPRSEPMLEKSTSSLSSVAPSRSSSSSLSPAPESPTDQPSALYANERERRVVQRGTARLVPCRRCVFHQADSKAQNPPVACYNQKGRGSACIRCTQQRQACVPVPPIVERDICALNNLCTELREGREIPDEEFKLVQSRARAALTFVASVEAAHRLGACLNTTLSNPTGQEALAEELPSPVTSQGSITQADSCDLPDRSITVQPDGRPDEQPDDQPVNQPDDQPDEQPSVRDAEITTSAIHGTRLENNVVIPQVDAHARWDLEIAGGKVVSRVPSAATSPPSLLLPSLCHPHIHLDKPYILNCHYPPSETYPNYDDLAPQSGSFHEALTNTSSAKARYTPEDLYLRGSQLLAESCGRHGVTAARTFVEVDHVVKFKTLETAIRLKKDFEHLIEIQICLFAQDPIFSTEHGGENRQLLLEAIDKFGDHIGALGTTPYVEQGADAGKKARAEIKNIEWAVDTAIEKGLHLDFHLDYNLDDTKQSSVFKVISRLRDYDWLANAQPGKTIVIGHCTQLTARTDELDRLRTLITEAPELPIHFVGLPTSDLFMMGRPEVRSNGQGVDYMPHARPRGTMQIPSMIKDFGLNGCLGVNNVGNAFTPYGNGDPLQLACWGTGIYQAGAVGDPELLYECVSTRARRAIGLLPAPSEGPEGEEQDNDVPLPGLLIRNFEDIELPGRDGGKLTVPARQRLSVRDVVWDPPDTNLRDILR